MTVSRGDGRVKEIVILTPNAMSFFENPVAHQPASETEETGTTSEIEVTDRPEEAAEAAEVTNRILEQITQELDRAESGTKSTENLSEDA